jgi:hypothetical protein
MSVNYPWERMVKLTVDHTKLTGDVTDFQTLLHWNGTTGNIPAEVYNDSSLSPQNRIIQWYNDDYATIVYYEGYAGSWATDSRDGFVNHDSHYSANANDYCEFSFFGTGIHWKTWATTYAGYADVYIDGVLDRSNVDTYLSGIYQPQTIVYSKTQLTRGNHTIKIVVKGANNGSSLGNYIAVDAFGVETQGHDIRFTSDPQGLNELPFEIVDFHPFLPVSVARVEIWVGLPSVSSATDTPFYMWYHNQEVSTTVIDDATTGTGLNQYEFVGTWSTYSPDNEYYGGSFHYGTETDAYYQVRFNGTQIMVYNSRNDGHGIMAYSIDGGAETLVDHLNATRIRGQLMYLSPVLKTGDHILKARITGTKNPTSTGYYTDVDFCIVLKNTEYTYNGITGTGLGQFEFVGNWTAYADAGASQGLRTYSNTTDNYYQIRFYGTQIQISARKNNDLGIGAYSIDGGAETNVDQYNASNIYQQLLYTSAVLTLGYHTLKIRVTGTKNASSSNYWVEADYMYAYGVRNYADNATYGLNNVWGPNYSTVWHMTEPSNSTALINHGTTDNPGKIGHCREFTAASSTYLEYTAGVISGGTCTFEFWAYGKATLPAQSTIYGAIDSIGDHLLLAHVPWDDSNGYFDFGSSGYDRISGAMTTAQIKGQWNYWYIRHDNVSGNMSAYCNGTLVASGTGKTKTITTSADAVWIGGYPGQSFYYDGYIDEMRISTVVKSDAWEAANYASQNAPETFLISGSPVEAPWFGTFLNFFKP